jgi:hypothetical protein
MCFNASWVECASMIVQCIFSEKIRKRDRIIVMYLKNIDPPSYSIIQAGLSGLLRVIPNARNKITFRAWKRFIFETIVSKLISLNTHEKGSIKDEDARKF